jgi:hypothetical protein
VTATEYDNEIDAIVDAAVVDLLTSGVSAAAVEDPDSYVLQAIILYAKAQFGLDNPDAERYMQSYQALAGRLAMTSEYQQPFATGITGDITAGSDELTVSDDTMIAEDAWLSVAGAGAGGALLVAKAEAVSDDVVTLSRYASTTVTDAAVTVL